MLYYSEEGQAVGTDTAEFQVPAQRSWYTPTPFSNESDSYRGMVSMKRDPDGDCDTLGVARFCGAATGRGCGGSGS
jgi:hypothetical protein